MANDKFLNLECEYCAGKLIQIAERQLKCDHCGNIKILKAETPSEIITMLNEANLKRNKGEFDDAYEIFEEITILEKTNPEGFWGCFLCEYGIMHVLDPISGKYIPTCNRASDISVYENNNYKQVIKLSSEEQITDYNKKADQIETIRKKIVKLSENESPYDIFICYKRTASSDNDDALTKDSELAGKIYSFLVSKGYKVFFAQETLQNLAGAEYEPLIYNAIRTSKVMLVVGSRQEYLNAPWVKNEWRRFLKQKQFDKTKQIIPIMCGGMNASRLPDILRNIQGLEMDDLNFSEKLLQNIKRYIVEEDDGDEELIPVVQKREVNKLVKPSETKKFSENNYPKGIKGIKLKLAENFYLSQMRGGLQVLLFILIPVLIFELIIGVSCSGIIVKAYDLLNVLSIVFFVISLVFAIIFERFINTHRSGTKVNSFVRIVSVCFIFLSMMLCVAYIVWGICKKIVYNVPNTNFAWLYMFVPFVIGLMCYILCYKKEDYNEGFKPVNLFAMVGALSLIVPFVTFQSSINMTVMSKYSVNLINMSVVDKTNIEVSLGGEGDWDDIYTINLTTRVVNNGKYDIEEIQGIVYLYNLENNNLTSANVSILSIIEENAAIEIGFNLYITNENNAETIWNSNYDELGVRFKFTFVEYSDGTQIASNDILEKTIKTISNSNNNQDLITQQNQNKYDQATNLFNQGKYEEAKILYQELNGYLDSYYKIADCDIQIIELKYQDAKSLFDKGFYYEAKAIFLSLGDYKDCEEMLLECEAQLVHEVYTSGLIAFNEKKYVEAYNIFKTIEVYADSATIIQEIEEIIISEADKFVEVGDYTQACDKLESIGFNSYNSELYKACVQANEGMYSSLLDYYNTTSFTIPEGTTEIKTGAFKDCTDLLEINLPSSLKTINQFAFEGCSSLIGIEIPASVKNISKGMLRGCTSLSRLTVPINSIYFTIFSLFEGEIPYSGEIPSTLKEITINAGTTISDLNFGGCTSVTTINLPDSITSISNRAFSGLTLTELIMPEGVTEIYDGMFDGLNVSKLVLPNTLVYIGMRGFSGIKGLEGRVIHYNGTKEQWIQNVKTNGSYWSEGAPLDYICCSDYVYNINTGEWDVLQSI